MTYRNYILAYNCNYQQEFVKQKKRDRFSFTKITILWVNFIDIAVVMQNWNNIIGPNVYVPTVALLCSMMQSNIFCLTNPC